MDSFFAIAIAIFVLAAVTSIMRSVRQTTGPRCWWAKGTRVILVEETDTGLQETGTAPIQRLVEGDRILTYNHLTGKYECGVVAGLMAIRPIELRLFEAIIGDDSVAVSSETRFWNDGWYRISDLLLKQAPPDSFDTVISWPATDLVYAIWVEPIHTFVAQVGDTRIAFADTRQS